MTNVATAKPLGDGAVVVVGLHLLLGEKKGEREQKQERMKEKGQLVDG